MDLFTLPSTEEEAVSFLQEKGLIPLVRECPTSPDHIMKLHYIQRGIVWRCTNSACWRKLMSVKVGTWFHRSKLSLVKALRFLYGWSQEVTSLSWCKKHLGLNVSTAADWKRCVRDVITEDLDRRPSRKIGGDGLIVEVVETVIKDLKTNIGKVPPPQWIVAGICPQKGHCFLKMAPNRCATAFLDVIKDNIAEGSTIHSDCWKQYNSQELEAAGFQHFAASHRLNFVDTVIEDHNKTIDVIWESMRWSSKREMGLIRAFLDSYLTEFIWRHEIGDMDPFDALLEAIKRSSLKHGSRREHSGPTKSNEEDLNCHLLEGHGCADEVVQQTGNAVENIPELCPACEVGFESVTDFLVHAVEVHGFNGTVRQEVFPSFSAFEQWRAELEEEHDTHWIRRGERTEHKVYYRQMRCQRARRTNSKKRTPNQSSAAVQKTCTSFMNVKRYLTSDVTNVEYCLEHFGHDHLPQKPRLPLWVKMEIAEMRKRGLPIVEIVRVLRNEKRQHSVTIHDVRRVAAKLKGELKKLETEESASAEERIKPEPDLAENLLMSDAPIKEEPSAMPTSAFKIEPSTVEHSMFETSVKEEPRSTATTVFSVPSAGIQLTLVEAQAPLIDGIPVFTLAPRPDGKGFALVNQSPCTVGQQNVSWRPVR